MGKTFTFAKGDADWKAKRTAVHHAFFQTRIEHMIATLKSQIADTVDSWKATMTQSGTNMSHDCLREFEKLYAKNILTILFGEDLTNTKIKFDFRVTENGKEFETRDATLSEAFDEVNAQILLSIVQKLVNPIQPIFAFFCRRTISFTNYQKTVTNNCQIIRDFVREYIAKRKSGEVKSKVENEDDLLTVFLSQPETFTDEIIIDELCSLYFASVTTSALASAMLLVHFMKVPSSLQKVRQEIQQAIDDESKLRPELQSMSLREKLDAVIDLRRVHEFEWLGMCFSEGLRFQGPAYTSSNFFLTEDAKVCNYEIKAKDEVIINYYGLHFNSNEWQRPNEFLPERFDISSPLYLTPSGKKRNPYSFTPFNGGRRGCIGQTFAEKNIKTVLCYMISYFDFEFADKDELKKPYPLLHLGQSKKVPIEVNVSNRQDQSSQ